MRMRTQLQVGVTHENATGYVNTEAGDHDIELLHNCGDF